MRHTQRFLGIQKATNRQIKSRIGELEKLKIKSIALTGPTELGRLSVLGKGYVGIVVLAKRNSKKVALKIRRTDSQRGDMRPEGRLLRLVNSVGVGPKIIDVSKNFLVMEYLEGGRIGQWVENLKGAGSSKKLKHAVRKILEDCYKLDSIGLDHGELSNVSKHVIIGEPKISLIDFESSSTKRRPANVTSVTQAIFIGSGIARKAQRVYKNPSKEKIIKMLKKYKHEKTQENFLELLKILKL